MLEKFSLSDHMVKSFNTVLDKIPPSVTISDQKFRSDVLKYMGRTNPELSAKSVRERQRIALTTKYDLRKLFPPRS